MSQYLAENWELLSFDVIYKTNQFNMPLAQVTGITGCTTTFSVAWALLDNEREESHNWYLDELRRTEIGRQICMPAVVISDYDNAFRAARREVFPGSERQLCLWHVMKNVTYNVKIG